MMEEYEQQTPGSPRRYSVLQSTAPRFPDSSHDVPFGLYNTDAANKQTITSHARDNRRFYAAVFDSQAGRFGRPWTSPVTDAFYDVNHVSNCKSATISHALHTTSHNYAILRSGYKRFDSKPLGEGPDVVYDIDRGHKKTMYTEMLGSARTYKNISGGLANDPILALAAAMDKPKRKDTTSHLGPGAYDYKHPYELTPSSYMDHRPLSSMMSRSARFSGGAKSSGIGLSSTWTQDKDDRSWAKRGTKMSRAEYLRPQYLPKFYKGQAQKAGAAKA